MKFIADVMVGKLARWLRVMGFDVAYSNVAEDDEIIRVAEAEDRIILTRDTGIAARTAAARCLLIEDDDYKQQIRQVVRTFDLKDFNVFSRCLECNTLLEEVHKEAVFEKIPPYVYLTQERFAMCPACGRIYWHGTHANEMLKQLKGE
jgi:uncharacterized protein with PIN domain